MEDTTIGPGLDCKIKLYAISTRGICILLSLKWQFYRVLKTQYLFLLLGGMLSELKLYCVKLIGLNE